MEVYIMKKKVLFVSLLIILIVTLIFIIGVNSIAEGQKEVKIGAAVAISGFLAREGSLVKEGYDFWSEYVNSKGGIKVGDEYYKINMIYYDDESDSIKGNKLVEKLITEDKADVIFGSYGSGIVFATSAITEKYHKLMLAPLSTSNSLYERGYKYIFNPAKLSSYNGKWWVEYFASLKPKPKTMGVIVLNDLFPLSTVEGLKKPATENGIEIVNIEMFSKGTKDFTSMLLKIKQNNPDIIFLSCYFQDELLALQQMRELDINSKLVFMSITPSLSEVYTILGADSDGIIGEEVYNPNMPYKDPIFGSNKEFLELWHKKSGGVNPEYTNIYGILVGEVYQAAVEKAGSIDTEKVRQALLDMDQEFITGRVRFMESGAPYWNPPYPLIMWKNGKVEYLSPPEGATAEPIYPKRPWSK